MIVISNPFEIFHNIDHKNKHCDFNNKAKRDDYSQKWFEESFWMTDMLKCREKLDDD